MIDKQIMVPSLINLCVSEIIHDFTYAEKSWNNIPYELRDIISTAQHQWHVSFHGYVHYSELVKNTKQFLTHHFPYIPHFEKQMIKHGHCRDFSYNFTSHTKQPLENMPYNIARRDNIAFNTNYLCITLGKYIQRETLNGVRWRIFTTAHGRERTLLVEKCVFRNNVQKGDVMTWLYSPTTNFSRITCIYYRKRLIDGMTQYIQRCGDIVQRAELRVCKHYEQEDNEGIPLDDIIPHQMELLNTINCFPLQCIGLLVL